jgi:hypothetical protein
LGEEVRIVFEVLVRKPEGKKPLGKPGKRWRKKFFDIAMMLIYCPYCIHDSTKLLIRWN